MIYAFVTLYNPSKNVPANVSLISQQVDKVFIGDNSSISNYKLFAGISKIEYKAFQSNLGLSKAFNKIISENISIFEDEDFLLFFDQDSVIPENHIKKLITEYEVLEKNNINIGVLGPSYFNKSSGLIELPRNLGTINEYSFEVSNIITSSMLCKFKNLRAINFWNENIFLDMADWDLCWRFKNDGKKCCVTTVSNLEHQVGKTVKKILGITIIYDNEVREYYQVRESLKLLKENYVPFKYKIFLLYIIFIRVFLEIIAFDNKKMRFKYYLRGIKDYHKKINGQYK